MEFIINVLQNYSWVGIIILAVIAFLLILFLIVTSDKHKRKKAELKKAARIIAENEKKGTA
ncbi:MAG: hypothetical protein IJK77_05540 [Lachnospiraceae bacterium]|nr:hypothetical protein [Lachnospiraceae bacterium]